ncbi:hypothetical protein DXG03_005845 [Asterophora parasitica]|uniref:Uncharacterized protein n=1 Tax=Asterophora parasitica TaxID=117018 RepID=A0A9P7G012_9AGAR|nr:hypothetical protein DXG03_005845 [Asterophora parasitica]
MATNGAAPGNNAATLDALAGDVAQLGTLLSQSELSERDDVDVAELLKRLESADGMANDLEGKLDGILATLDGILESIDPAAGGQGVEGVTTTSTESSKQQT